MRQRIDRCIVLRVGEELIVQCDNVMHIFYAI